MAVKRTTIELDETLAGEAVAITGGTLRSTVEEGLRLIVAQRHEEDERRRAQWERHLAGALKGIDVDVLASEEAWR